MRHVDVIVGMNRLLRSHLATGDLDRAVRDDLVHVHVRLRAGSGLPDAQRKMILQLPGDHLVGCLRDQLGLLVVQFAEIAIDQRRGLLEDGHRADDLARHHVARRSVVADVALAGSLMTPALAGVRAASPTPEPSAAAATPDAALVLDTARGKVAAGNTKAAIDGLAPYVAQHPEDAAAGRLLGDLYFRVPDYARAEKVWKAIVALAPDDRETHSRLGSLYAVQDRVSDAIFEFQKSLPSRTGFAGLVMIHKRARDLQQSITKLEYATANSPFEAGAWTELGQARRSMRQYDAALEAFTPVVGIRPGSCTARVDLANG